MARKTRKTTIDDFKDRLTSPINAIRVDKNGRPLKRSSSRSKSKKRGK